MQSAMIIMRWTKVRMRNKQSIVAAGPVIRLEQPGLGKTCCSLSHTPSRYRIRYDFNELNACIISCSSESIESIQVEDRDEMSIRWKAPMGGWIVVSLIVFRDSRRTLWVPWQPWQSWQSRGSAAVQRLSCHQCTL